MSDPIHGHYECRDHGPMQPVYALDDCEEHTAYLCASCLKWRHALPLGDPRRPEVVIEMERRTKDLYASSLRVPGLW